MAMQAPPEEDGADAVLGREVGGSRQGFAAAHIVDRAQHAQTTTTVHKCILAQRWRQVTVRFELMRDPFARQSSPARARL